MTLTLGQIARKSLLWSVGGGNVRIKRNVALVFARARPIHGTTTEIPVADFSRIGDAKRNASASHGLALKGFVTLQTKTIGVGDNGRFGTKVGALQFIGR